MIWTVLELKLLLALSFCRYLFAAIEIKISEFEYSHASKGVDLLEYFVVRCTIFAIIRISRAFLCAL